MKINLYTALVSVALFLGDKNSIQAQTPPARYVIQTQTGFVAFGARLQKGVVVPVMNMVDAAPFIAKLTGISLNGTDGKLYPEIV